MARNPSRMSLSRKIADLVSFTLPRDWHESKPNPDDDQSSQTDLDELTSLLTPEALRAITPHLENSREQAAIDCELAPEQYAAAPNWSTPENLATLSIFADVVFYSNWELESTDALLQSQSAIPAKEVTQAGRSIFSMWYSNGGRLSMSASDAEDLPATVPADPALLEAFYEMKATLQRIGGDIESDFKVISAHAGHLSEKPAAIVETEHYVGGIIEKQMGFHLLLDRERNGDDWQVQEVHILLRCTPANAEYLQPEFQSFLDSIRWLPAAGRN